MRKVYIFLTESEKEKKTLEKKRKQHDFKRKYIELASCNEEGFDILYET